MNKTTFSQPRARELNYFSRNENYIEEEETEELNVVDNQQDYPNRPSFSNNYNNNYARNNNAPNWRNNNYNSGPYQSQGQRNMEYPRPTEEYQRRARENARVENVEHSASGFAEIKKMLQKMIDAQASDKLDINNRVDSVTSHFSGRIEALAGKFGGLETHVKNLEKELISMIPSAAKSEGKKPLTTKTEESPKDYGQYISNKEGNLRVDERSTIIPVPSSPIYMYEESEMLANATGPAYHKLLEAEYYNKVVSELKLLLRGDQKQVNRFEEINEEEDDQEEIQYLNGQSRPN